MDTLTPRSEQSNPQEPEAASLSPSPLPTPVDIGNTEPNTAAFVTSALRGAEATPKTDNLALASPLPLGSMVSGYVIAEFLGRGGMGVVVKACHADTGHVVAIKMIRDGIFADTECVQRFLREIQALDRAQRIKNIVPIYHVGQHESQTFYTMPYFAHGSLGKQLRRFREEPRKAVALIEKIARAVHELHRNNILHRDIKPGNILLGDDDEPCLGDFGLIKFLDNEQSLTASNQRLGTPPYMAPEQTGLVQAPINEQTDVWAIGVLLYEVLMGQRPFASSKSDDTTKLFWKIINEAPPKPRSLKPDLDAGLEAVILKCLEKKPADRFTTMEALADELGRWLRAERLQTAPSTFGTRLRGRIRKHPRLAALLVLLAMVPAVAVEVQRRGAPDYVHNSIRSEFVETGSVVLVPPTGAPRWHSNPLDSRLTAYVDKNDGIWRIETWSLALVELLRDLPVEGYQFRAEIRHEKTNTAQGFKGQAGIFIGHQAVSDGGPPRHLWCDLRYNDIVDYTPPPIPQLKPQPGNPAKLYYHLFARIADDNVIDQSQDWTKPAWFQRAGIQADRWRVLELQMRQGNIVARFDDLPIQPLAREFADGAFLAKLKKLHQQDPARYGPLGEVKQLELSPRGSLGLIVSDSTIAVRNVKLTRILDQK
jgi:eukaryotic-like serine/threonine-protein kinase